MTRSLTFFLILLRAYSLASPTASFKRQDTVPQYVLDYGELLSFMLAKL